MAKPLTVVTEIIPPYQTKNEDGSVGGYATQVVRRLFQLTGQQPDIIPLPWGRAYLMAQKEPNVLIYSMIRTVAREEQFQWIGNLHTQRFYMWGLKKNFDKPFSDLSQAKPYRIATSKGYGAAYLLAENNFDNVLHTARNDQNVGMLFKERVDIIFSSEVLLYNRIKKLGYSNEDVRRLYEVAPLSRELSIAFSRESNPHLVLRFQVAFNYLERTGELEKIRRQWDIIER
ncbi:transporter substrate-binding domain-containing protein [Psychrobium sp. MM17-31]|uniref:substrate-binding periplasmic protein n=1 Tax=Psychrobium sp. MM17-31 TaxID=2917758 RepID=UPI001EF435B8|nr:transporter substrate-binding domain-containing protein [Psychrobium sp. MM17-31]MCG7533008.1 transporter substrate-binding domain-containing protein [Psychrobium sp. MM17-31]